MKRASNLAIPTKQIPGSADGGGFGTSTAGRDTLAEMIAYCADIGSVPEGNFAWAKAHREAGATVVTGGSSIDGLVDGLAADLGDRAPVSLGIEAPLFLPVPVTSRGLSCGRDGDGNRSCFASAGACVTTLGLHELAYVLSRLRARVPSLSVTLDPATWHASATKTLLLWEAFVSGAAHTTSKDHVQDAASGAVRFLDNLEAGAAPTVTVQEPREVLSLAGAVLLWAGLTTNLAELRRLTLVVKPTEPWVGKVERV